MKATRLHLIGVAVSIVGLFITFTMSWSIGLAIACIGGFGLMSVSAFRNTRASVQPGSKGERLSLALGYTLAVLMGLIAIAPLVLVIGIFLTSG